MEDTHIEEAVTNTSSPASFSGSSTIAANSKLRDGRRVSKHAAAKWLETQDYYTLQRQPRLDFARATVVVPYVNYQWDIDTAFMLSYSKYNKSYKYFILTIDVMSKFVHARAVKSIKAEEVVDALKDIFESSSSKPKKVRSDLGVEFKNTKMKAFLERENVDQFFAETDKKANVAERAIKTIKSKLVSYMRKNSTNKWIDVLQNIVKSYNSTTHSSTGVTPRQGVASDSTQLWKRIYDAKKRKTPYPKNTITHKYKVGDNVRISLVRQPYAKAYDEKWTQELFAISSLKVKEQIPVYTLKDWNNKPIGGIFYQAEVQHVRVDENKTYSIEKIIKTRKVGGEKQHFVKWKGWPKTYNSWVRDDDLEGYKN